jgi:hypothetical protein
MAYLLLIVSCVSLAFSAGCDCNDNGGPVSDGATAESGSDDGAVVDEAVADSSQPACASYTSITADISTSQTLDGCYLVEKKITITNNAVLTIAAGSVLVFKQDTGFYVEPDGAMKAEGTAAEPILFTGETKTRGFWNGLRFHNNDSSNNILDHVVVEFGGGEKFPYGEQANVAVTSSGLPVTMTITNSILRQSAGFGCFIDQLTTLSSFANNTLTGNATGAAFVEDDAVSQLDASTTCTGNDADIVWVAASGITASQTWPALDVPYLIDGDLHIGQSPGVTLTLSPGTTFRLRENSGFTVGANGTLVAKGTAGSPITFTWADQGKHWQGILFHNSDTPNVLERVVVSYGGGKAPAYGDKANIALTSSGFSARLTLTDSQISNSAGYGAWVCSTCTLTQSGHNMFSGNAESPDVFQP